MIKFNSIINFLVLVIATASMTILWESLPIGSLAESSNSPPGLEIREPIKTADQQQLLLELPNDQKPIQVKVGVYLINIALIDQSNEAYEVTGYIFSSWRDPRLSFDSQKTKVDKITIYNRWDIWTPKMSIINAKFYEDTLDDITVYPDGRVDYYQKFAAKLSSKFSLKFFPFDTQKLILIIESEDYPRTDMIMKVDQANTGVSKDAYALPSEWYIKGIKTTIKPILFSGENAYYDRLTLEIIVQRYFAFYIWKLFLPLILINCISWSVFWIDSKSHFSSQISLNVSSLICLITFGFLVSINLPKVPYLILIDGLFMLSYIFVFITLMISVSCHYFNNNQRENLALKLQTYARFTVPLIFLGCNVILWLLLGWE